MALGNIPIESFVYGVKQNNGIATKYPIGLGVFTVATVPSATKVGALIYVSDGAAGSPVVAFSNGTNWLRVDTLAAISAS